MKQSLYILIILIFTFTDTFGQNIQNPGFEDWETIGPISEPVHWSSIKTSDDQGIADLAPVVWQKSTDAHTGNYSVQLTNVYTLIVATGIVTNGRIHAELNADSGYVYTNTANPGWYTSYTKRPDSVVIWAKYTPQGGDTAQVKVLLHKNNATLPPKPQNQGNRIGYAQINIVGTYTNWTRFSAPFTYNSTESPEYMLMVLTSGAGTQAIEGSTAKFDDMALIEGSAGIQLFNDSKSLFYIYNHELILDELPQGFNEDLYLDIFNLNGSLAFSATIQKNQRKVSLPVGKGQYIARVKAGQQSLSQKIIIQ